MLKLLRNFANGIALGITETVPGVSGGTIALLLGFYFELIETINHFTDDIKKRLAFLTPIVFGTVVGLLVGFTAIHHLITDYSFPTMLFFIGLVAGIIPIVHDKVRLPNKEKPIQWIAAAVPFILLVVISSLREPTGADPAAIVAGVNAPYVLLLLVSGAAAAAALVIPGISGSFVLLLIGVYPVAIYSVKNLTTWLTDMGNIHLLADSCKVLVPLGIGIIIGGLSMVRLIERLLKKYHDMVYTIILGLMIGSVYALFRGETAYQSYGGGIPDTLSIVIGVATCVVGFATSFTLGKKKL